MDGRANLSKRYILAIWTLFFLWCVGFWKAGPERHDLRAPVTPAVLAVTFPGSRRPHRLGNERVFLPR